MERGEIKQYSIYYKNMDLGFTECRFKKIKQIYIKKTVTYALLLKLKETVINLSRVYKSLFPPLVDLFLLRKYIYTKKVQILVNEYQI